MQKTGWRRHNAIRIVIHIHLVFPLRHVAVLLLTAVVSAPQSKELWLPCHRGEHAHAQLYDPQDVMIGVAGTLENNPFSRHICIDTLRWCLLGHGLRSSREETA